MTDICSAHFLSDDFEEGPILMVGSGIDVTRKRILKPSAVPTLFPTPSQIRQGTGDFATATPPAKRHRSAYFEKREKTQVLDSLLKPRLTADGASAAHTSTACSDASDDPMQETPGTMTSACQTDPVKEKKKPQRSKGVQTKPREKTTGTPIERKLFQDTGSQCNIIPTPKKEAEGRDLVLGGDGRADSPGHCAKCGSYTMLELHANVVIDIQLVQEPRLLQNGSRLCLMYRTYTQAMEGRESHKKWLEPSSKAAVKLEKLVCNKTLCNDMLKLSGGCQTSAVEGFHSLLIQFAPKMYVFSYTGMLCRILIAALHFNENANRVQGVTKAGEAMYSIKYPKGRKGAAVLRRVLESPTYEYAQELLAEGVKE
ncbi:hypothetical protein KUCAC02_016532 [Chaenocephalus aceratus]|nr:hypothetical protein KUCAC02_016532 [Chaenocephalus aceratus]